MTNNTLVRPFQITVPTLPILSIASVSAPADVWSGQQILVSWVLTNSGSGPVEGTFYDGVFLTTDAAGSNPQQYGLFPFTGQIPAHSSVLRKELINLPISLSGTFWVEVQDDMNQQVFQFTNRPNETLVASQPTVVHLTPTPDLSIASILAPTNVFSSGQELISWVETNSGSGPTSSPYWYDAVYLSGSTNMNDPNYFTYLGAVGNASYLDSGDSYSNSLAITVPRGLNGTFYFLVQADAFNYVFETNKANNVSASAPVFVNATPTPDLQVTSVGAPHSAFSGQIVPITWAVTNLGEGQVPPKENQLVRRDLYVHQ